MPPPSEKDCCRVPVVVCAGVDLEPDEVFVVCEGWESVEVQQVQSFGRVLRSRLQCRDVHPPFQLTVPVFHLIEEVR